MTFDEFKAKYADHITGKAEPQKGARRHQAELDDGEAQNTSQNEGSDAEEAAEGEEDVKIKPKTPDEVKEDTQKLEEEKF